MGQGLDLGGEAALVASGLVLVEDLLVGHGVDDALRLGESFSGLGLVAGGNDYLNTVIPYNNALYRDNRKAVSIGDNHIMQLDKTYGIPSYLAPMKQFWDDGNLAIMHGVGYLDSPRSHFRSMDIWHTCEPDKVGTEGWLGQAMKWQTLNGMITAYRECQSCGKVDHFWRGSFGG